jgi:succinyl-CoA synthetase alpha subunit
MQAVQDVGHLLLDVWGASGTLFDEVVQQVFDAEGGTLLLQGIGSWS